MEVPRGQKLIIGARWSWTARGMRCGFAEEVFLQMGEGGCNSMLSSANTVITLHIVDTTSRCMLVVQVRRMYSLLY